MQIKLFTAKPKLNTDLRVILQGLRIFIKSLKLMELALDKKK